MQLKILAWFLAVLSVDALPVANPILPMITVPLTRIRPRQGRHPQIHLQQLINRADGRLARMTKRTGPTEAEKADRLQRRVMALEGDEGLERRFSRIGVPTKDTKAAELLLIRHAGGKKLSKLVHGGSGNATVTCTGVYDSADASVACTGAYENGANTAAAISSSSSSTATSSALGVVETTGVTFANSPTAENSLGLAIEGPDIGYLAIIQMGTPPKNFLLLMDSGSADLWVGGEDCLSQSGGGCGDHQFLGTNGSSTFRQSKTRFAVRYGTGDVAGDVVQDNIVIAGLALNAHTFGVATRESVEFSANTTPFDGLMGLAQSKLSKQGALTPIEALAAAGLVQEAITSFKISRLSDNKNDGDITFGGLDTTKFDSSTLVTLENVDPHGFWAANLDSVIVNGADVGLRGRTAILDTGTTLIIAPPSDAAAIHQAIPGSASDGQGGFTIPCTTNATVALTFGGTSFAIDTRDITFQPVNPSNPTGKCISGIASGNVGGAMEWLVGDVFLKNAYFSTNVRQNTVSLAKLV